MKIVLAIEYVGTRYHGWQFQRNANSVQAEVERALSKIACEPIKVYCAGRTDKGVHASHQIVHFNTVAERDLKAWYLGTNTHLPDDINIVWAKVISDDFHARFSAQSRAYHYVIYNDKIRPTHYAEGVTWHPHHLDEQAMQIAAKYLIGEHDFSSFRDKECQAKHPIRTIQFIHVQRYGKIIVLHLKANAFLHHMVRNIVGTLLPIGQGIEPASWMDNVLQAKDRTQAGITAPSAGLYLTEVNYPEQYDLPSEQRIPWVIHGCI